jgi:hypothetical protein
VSLPTRSYSWLAFWRLGKMGPNTVRSQILFWEHLTQTERLVLPVLSLGRNRQVWVSL